MIASTIAWVIGLPETVKDRLVALLLLLPSASVLGIASYLTPNPAGMGTHRQLGLGGCAVLTLTGYPCPMCGMTTTFTHLAHLHFIEGTLNQPFGLFLFSITVLAAAIGVLDLVSPAGRWRAAWRWIEQRETAVAIFLLSGMGLGWIYKIILVHGFPPW